MMTLAASTTDTSQSRSGQPDRLGLRRASVERGIDLRSGRGPGSAAARRWSKYRRSSTRLAAKLGRDLVFHRLAAAAWRRRAIGLEQQLAAAGEVEPEVDMLAPAPSRAVGSKTRAGRKLGTAISDTIRQIRVMPQTFQRGKESIEKS